MQAHRGKHRQVQHGDPGALQDQRVTAVARSQPPTQPEQPQGCRCNACVTQFNRHHHAFGGIAQQKGQAEEQQHHADPQHGIAAEQPGAGTADGAIDEVRATGCDRRLCFASGWFRFPGIGDFAGRCGDWLEFGWQLPDQFRGCGRYFIKEGFRRYKRFTGFRRLDARCFEQRQPLLDRLQRYLRLLQQALLLDCPKVHASHANGLADPQSE
ncbi:hypothetical protein D3C87_1036900 [compost metagenome]